MIYDKGFVSERAEVADFTIVIAIKKLSKDQNGKTNNLLWGKGHNVWLFNEEFSLQMLYCWSNILLAINICLTKL